MVQLPCTPASSQGPENECTAASPAAAQEEAPAPEVEDPSPISAGQEAETAAAEAESEPKPEIGKTTEINVEDSASNLQPERAENPINAAVSTTPQEASLDSPVQEAFTPSAMQLLSQ